MPLDRVGDLRGEAVDCSVHGRVAFGELRRGLLNGFVQLRPCDPSESFGGDRRGFRVGPFGIVQPEFEGFGDGLASVSSDVKGRRRRQHQKCEGVSGGGQSLIVIAVRAIWRGWKLADLSRLASMKQRAVGVVISPSGWIVHVAGLPFGSEGRVSPDKTSTVAASI